MGRFSTGQGILPHMESVWKPHRIHGDARIFTHPLMDDLFLRDLGSHGSHGFSKNPVTTCVLTRFTG